MGTAACWYTRVASTPSVRQKLPNLLVLIASDDAKVQRVSAKIVLDAKFNGLQKRVSCKCSISLSLSLLCLIGRKGTQLLINVVDERWKEEVRGRRVAGRSRVMVNRWSHQG